MIRIKECFKCYKRIWPWQKCYYRKRVMSESMKMMKEQFGHWPQWPKYEKTPLTYHLKCALNISQFKDDLWSQGYV